MLCTKTKLFLTVCLSLSLGACFEAESSDAEDTGSETGDRGETDAPPATGSEGGMATTAADDTDDSSDDESGLPPGGCEDAEGCAPELPSGWNGPVSVYFGDEPAPSCPTAFTGVVDGNQNLLAEPAVCDCECGDATGIDCSVNLRPAGGDSCEFSLGGRFNLDDGVCEPVGTDSTRFSVAEPTASGGSCVARGESPVVPQATWGTTVRACEAPAGNSCDGGGTCVPDPGPGFGTTCIYVEGDSACPAGPYNDQQVVHRTLEDTRGCDTCTCGDPTGSCGGEVRFILDACGGPNTAGSIDVDTCGTIIAAAGGARYVADPSFDCAPTGGDATGSATPSDPVTLCCL